MLKTASRYHDISCGHRVYGHEGKCRFLHGHNYRIHFDVIADDLDAVGRVIDFSVIKTHLCDWLEQRWDHRFLIWQEDPLSRYLLDIDKEVVLVPFNPTAENMAAFLLMLGHTLLPNNLVRLRRVRVEETRKCSAEAEWHHE